MNIKSGMKIVGYVFVAFVAFYFLMIYGNYLVQSIVKLNQKKETNIYAAPGNLPNYKLTDNKSVYSYEGNINSLYITTFTGTNPAGTKTFSLTDLNNDFDYNQGVNTPQVNVLVKEGSLNGIFGKLGFGIDTFNGSMRVRGHSTRLSDYKSYKIKLYDGNYFLGYDTININKHPHDCSKLMNKFCYDLISFLPDMVSLRTEFVHVYIKEGSVPNGDYVDYGLYTFVEEPDKSYLSLHNLSPNGALYKAESFEFYLYDELKAQDDPAYNEEEFDKRLAIKVESDNSKLINMLKDINDTSKDFDAVFNKYFDKDNYLTWLAVNITLGNLDTTSQNYMIYSPENSEKWYFLPWDYDGCLDLTDTIIKANATLPEGFRGLSRYYTVSLHKRFFSNPKNIEALDKKIEDIYKVFTSDKAREMLARYKKVVVPLIDTVPYGRIATRMKSEIAAVYIDEFFDIMGKNKALYYKIKNFPLPIHLSVPEKTEDGGMLFKWSESRDIQGDLIHYELTVARDPDFNDVVVSENNLYSIQYKLTTPLPAGDYFFKIRVVDTSGNEQFAYDYYRDPNDVKHYGFIQFTVD